MHPKPTIFAAIFISSATLHALKLAMPDFPIPLELIGALWGGWLASLGYETARWIRRRRLPREVHENPDAVVVEVGGFFKVGEDDQHIYFGLGEVHVPKSVPVVIAGKREDPFSDD